MRDFSIFDCCYFFDSVVRIKIDVGFQFLCVCLFSIHFDWLTLLWTFATFRLKIAQKILQFQLFIGNHIGQKSIIIHNIYFMDLGSSFFLFFAFNLAISTNFKNVISYWIFGCNVQDSRNFYVISCFCSQTSALFIFSFFLSNIIAVD